MKKCKHDFELGIGIWKKEKIKIRAKCIYCKKYVLFDFESINFRNNEEKGLKNELG